MKLTGDQLKQFNEQGFLFFPDCFHSDEVAVLRNEAKRVYELEREEVVVESSGVPPVSYTHLTLPTILLV